MQRRQDKQLKDKIYLIVVNVRLNGNNIIPDENCENGKLIVKNMSLLLKSLKHQLELFYRPGHISSINDAEVLMRDGISKCRRYILPTISSGEVVTLKAVINGYPAISYLEMMNDNIENN